MAGFFKSFNREGKGVAKDAPNKKRFVLCFEIMWNHAWEMIGINLIYFVITLPLMLFIFMYAFQTMGIESEAIMANSLFKVSAWFLNFPDVVKYGLIGLSAILYGPATCGLTYVMRNFARREHTWAFSDFFERSWQNFLQGFLVGVLDILIILSASMYAALDTNTLAQGDGYLAVFKYIAVIVSILYFIMRNYIYIMIVTFKIRFAAIIKNAALSESFSSARILRTSALSARMTSIHSVDSSSRPTLAITRPNTALPGSSPTPGACSNSCPSNQ